MKPLVELVSTGSELLNGRTVNSHARLLGERLRSLGLALTRDTTVPDDRAVITHAVKEALARVDIVVTSGGLGPTSDDVTREAVADVYGRKTHIDSASLEEMRRKYTERGRVVTAAAERQVYIVDGAVALANRVGISPGQRCEAEGKVIFVLPGPPAELLAVLDDHVMPWLAERFGGLRPPTERILLTTGIGESDIVTRLEEAAFPPEGIEMSYCAAPGRVEIKLTGTGTRDDALEHAAEELKKLLGSKVYAEERLAMQDVVARLLTERGATLAVAESCTGGLVSDRITSVSGSSAYFLGGIVAYANDVKQRELGVSADALEKEGAVSERVAREMANGVRERFRSDYGVAVTGIAGPAGGTKEKPVGLVYVAVAGPAGTEASRHTFQGERAFIKQRSCFMALNLLREALVS